METLLAVAIVAAIMPFAYNGVTDMAEGMADASESKRISEWRDPVMAYVRKNQADWPGSAQVEFDEEEVDVIRGEDSGRTRLMRPYAGFIDKRAGAGGVMIDAYLAFRPESVKEIRVHGIAKLLGADAAVVGDGGEAASAAGWSISSDVFSSGDLIYKISDILGEDETWKYLHRTYLNDDDMSAMQRDLDMAKHDMFDASAVSAGTLNASNGNLWFGEAPELRATEVFFPEGASIDASKASLNSVNVTGDISGFRKIAARRLKGFGVLANSTWSQRGDVVVDGAAVTEELHVQRDLTVKSESSRTISGFAGVSANSLATPYLSAGQLIFAKGYGITISSELMYSTTDHPIKLGSWTFPSASGPKFSSLLLRKAGAGDLSEALASPIADEFAPIMTDGWKDR